MAELLSACQLSAAMMLAASDAGSGCPPAHLHNSDTFFCHFVLSLFCHLYEWQLSPVSIRLQPLPM